QNIGIKKKTLNTVRPKKTVTYKRNPMRLSVDFSTETLQARRELHDIFKVLNGKNLQPGILYPARLSFRTEGEMKSFPDKQKLKECLATKPALHEILKETL
ncbi:LORF1 protein, partial [Crocuta crocuta]